MTKRVFLILLFSPILGLSQILDDSTRQVYGPFSTGFLYEKNFILDDTLLLHPDTLLHDFHYMTPNRASGWLWQDLGNAGTASRNLLFETPDNAFTEPGLTSFSSLYGKKTEEIKYYNTRSPFTNMAYTQSGNGMGILGFTHAQNINPNWNMALDLRRIASSKQYSGSTSEDRLVDHWDYSLGTNYTTRNRKYTLLAAFIHFNHKQIEQGGIRPLNGEPFVLPQDIAPDYNTQYQQLLTSVESRERWNDLHLYQQYQFGKGFQFFHTGDFQLHKFFYTDTLLAINELTGIYPDSVSGEKMKNAYILQNIQNRVGFKGVFKGFKYNVGITSRIYAWHTDDENASSNTRTEILAGGNAGYWLNDSLGFVDTDLYLGVGNNLNVFLKSQLKFRRLNLLFKFVNKPPYLFYQNFESEALNWDSSFEGLRFTEVSGNIQLGKHKAWIKPGARVVLFDNYLYFDVGQKPVQNSGQLLLNTIELDAGVNLSHWKLSGRFFLNNVSNSEILRVPQVILNTNLEYRVRYARMLDIYFGTDIYFRSKFAAYAYSPLLRSFYLQNDQSVWGLPIADVYTNFMIKRVKLAFSFNYLNQGIPTQGFFTTPNYLAMGRTFHLKVNWPLFD